MTLAPLFPPNNGFIAVLKKNLMYDRMRSISQVSQLISQIIMSLNDRLFWTVFHDLSSYVFLKIFGFLFLFLKKFSRQATQLIHINFTADWSQTLSSKGNHRRKKLIKTTAQW